MGSFAEKPLIQLTLARIREFGREPEAIFWTFFFPIVMALGLGIAFRAKGPEPVHVGVEAGASAETIVAALASEGRIEASIIEPEEAEEALRKGKVALVVADRGGDVVYRYDATRPESRLARLETDAALQRAAGREDPRAIRDELVTERGSRYIDFLIPGLIGLNLLGTGLWGVGFALVRMRTNKLLKRLAATPMNRGDFLLSFMFARLGFLAGELLTLLVVARLAFDVAIRGSVASVVAIAALGAFSFTGIGLLVASRARTIEAVSGLMNLASLPMWILSGVFFSADHFPDVVQPLIRILPLTAVVDALRAVMIDGAPLLATAGSLAVVAGWGIASFAVALAIFRWK